MTIRAQQPEDFDAHSSEEAEFLLDGWAHEWSLWNDFIHPEDSPPQTEDE